MEEIWKDVVGYEGLYQVSNLGRIKRDKLKKPELINKGYYRVSLSKDGTVRRYFVHRLVAEAFIPNPEKYPIVNHKDLNPLNNSIEIWSGVTISTITHMTTPTKKGLQPGEKKTVISSLMKQETR